MPSKPDMPTRDNRSQGLHDMIVNQLLRCWFDPLEFDIVANPGSQKNRSVNSDDIYPDLVASAYDGSHAWIAEVETEESVNEDEAQRQWTRYAATGIPFRLIVPLGSGAKARALSAKLGLKISQIREYSFLAGKDLFLN